MKNYMFGKPLRKGKNVWVLRRKKIFSDV